MTTALTPREREVLALLCSGCTDREIAEHLQMSRHTVNTYTNAIYVKLDVDARAAAAYRAGKEGLV